MIIPLIRLSRVYMAIWIDVFENKQLLKGKYIIIGIANINIITGKTNVLQIRHMQVDFHTLSQIKN